MVDKTEYPPGAPCWVDLTAGDFEDARRFYGDLFGWEFDVGGEDTGFYTMCRLGGAAVAGLTPLRDEGAPAVWSVYLASDSVDTTAQRIRDHGGTVVMDPLDVMQFGRMCFAEDPTGAAFGVWEAGTHIGSQKVGEPGAPAWHELNSREGKVADEFYSAVFGVQPEQIGDGANFDYAVWKVNGEQVAGRLQIPEDWSADIPSHWLTYFAVADANAAAARIAELGGTVVREPFDSPYGRIAVVTDPWAASFCVIQLAENPPS